MPGLSVGIVLTNGAGRIFFAERFNGTWHMPQGGLLENEAPRDAVFRELEEETGTKNATILAEHPEWLSYLVPPEMRPGKWDENYVGQTQKWFLLQYDGTDAEFNVDTEDPEFRQWRWATPEEVIDNAIEFKRELYPRVFDAFRDWL